MKTLHYSIIAIFSMIFIFSNNGVFADNTNSVEIQNIQVQPSTIKVGDSIRITATLVNNSTYPIFVSDMGSKDCQGPFFTIIFDDNVKVTEKEIACSYVALEERLDPDKKYTGTSPGLSFTYIATKAGTANVTVTFPYQIKNQTDPTQPNIEQTISKSFQFLIRDVNETYAQKPPAYFASPLQQIKAGVSAQSVKCGITFNLVIKSEDGSPACVKLDAAYMLIKRGWAASESAYPGGDRQFVLDTNSTIIPAHLPRSSGVRLPYYESSRVINYSGFDGVYNETFPYRGTQNDYVLKPGSTGVITFKLDAVASEQQGQDYPMPLPKSLNLTNYAVFYHEITSLADLSKYPGVTFDDSGYGHFSACSTGPAGSGTCIGGQFGGTSPIEAFVTDHPGVDVLFEPPAEVLPLAINSTSQVVTMTITADSNAPRGTYLVELPSVGVDSFLLTVGDRPYHE